jgi:hypothetical protein
VANGSVNARIFISGDGGFGSFAIQVGVGPMQIQVKYDAVLRKGQCTPDPVLVPVNGLLQIQSADSAAYSVRWVPGVQDGPFTPQIKSIPSLGSAQGSAPALPLDYTYTVTRIGGVEGDIFMNGGGTIKVKNT